MKNFKKILSLALAVCLVLCAVPMFTASADTETLADISYSNTFDEGDTLTDLKDFYAYWGPGQDGVFNWKKDITADISTTVSDTVGALGRKSIDESSGWKTTKEPIWNLVTATLMPQEYADFELTATMKMSSGASAMGFIIGQTTPGNVFYKSGSTGAGIGIMFKRKSDNNLCLTIVNSGEALANGVWSTYASSPWTANITDFTTRYGEGTSAILDVKLVVSGSKLNIYFKNESTGEWVAYGDTYDVGTRYELGRISLTQSTAETGGSSKPINQYFDNLAISGKGIERNATAGSSIMNYSNSFDGLTIHNIAEDFSVLYTVDCNNQSTGDYKYYYQTTPSAVLSHFYTQRNDGRVYLQRPTVTTETWSMNMYPTLLSYRHSKFDDFEMELVYNNYAGGPNHTLIQFGAAQGNQSAYNTDGSGGYTLGLKRTGGTAADLYILHKGNLTKICSYGDSGSEDITVAGYGSTIKESTIKVVVIDSNLTVSMLDNTDNYVVLYEAALDDYQEGYVAFGSDYGAGDSYYDSFSIKGTSKAPEIVNTASSITFVPRTGYEYSIDGGLTYTTENVFQNLDADTTYNVAQRVAAKNHLVASDAVAATAVTSADGNGYGDVTGNAVIDAYDLLAMRKELLKIADVTVAAAADMNNDGQVNIIDLVMLKKAIA